LSPPNGANQHHYNALIYFPTVPLASFTVPPPTPPPPPPPPPSPPPLPISSFELSPPQFPIGSSRQINDGSSPADWISLEGEEDQQRANGNEAKLASIRPRAGNGTRRFSTLTGGYSHIHLAFFQTIFLDNYLISLPPLTKLSLWISEIPSNPCAFGSGQMMLCQPTAAPSPCPGQQFCHVGDSPITTVCCNKPGLTSPLAF
jgi:hypothetical protein